MTTPSVAEQADRLRKVARSIPGNMQVETSWCYEAADALERYEAALTVCNAYFADDTKHQEQYEQNRRRRAAKEAVVRALSGGGQKS